jgi:sensor histidine kinase regulating citrate/malate metabolism
VYVPGRVIRFDPVGSCLIRTDPPVLRRIIGNMVLNAMEAVAIGDAVQVRCCCLAGCIRIEVSNQGEMVPDIQLMVFKRSFSSKAASGRGIGTYSMKLFGEHYLGGTVGFSCANGQTTFFIELPGHAVPVPD